MRGISNLLAAALLVAMEPVPQPVRRKTITRTGPDVAEVLYEKEPPRRAPKPEPITHEAQLEVHSAISIWNAKVDAKKAAKRAAKLDKSATTSIAPHAAPKRAGG